MEDLRRAAGDMAQRRVRAPDVPHRLVNPEGDHREADDLERPVDRQQLHSKAR